MSGNWWARAIQQRLHVGRRYVFSPCRKDTSGRCSWPRQAGWRPLQTCAVDNLVLPPRLRRSLQPLLEHSRLYAFRSVRLSLTQCCPVGARPFSNESTSLPPHIPIKMPALSPTMKAGNLLAWKRHEGDRVSPGDVLAEIETDKATIEFESQEEGVLAKILVPDGTQDVPVGTLIAVLAEEAEQMAALREHHWDAAAQTGARDSGTKSEPQQPDKSSPVPLDRDAHIDQESLPWRYGPAVATMLANHPVPAVWRSKLQPSGPRGHILKEDLLTLLEAAAKQEPSDARNAVDSSEREPGAVANSVTARGRDEPVTDRQRPRESQPAYREVPLSQVRRVIAERLLESKMNAPHAYQSLSVNFEALLELRQSVNTLSAGSLQALRAPKLTVNDFLLRAVSIALREHKSMNSDSDRVDLAFAVATPAGLITPIIRDADTKSVVAIALESQDLVQRARQNKLKLHEFQGGSFSISNLGMVSAITRFTAIINPPQAGILAIGAPQFRLVPDGIYGHTGGNVSPDDAKQTRIATLTLSYDASRVRRSAGIAFLVDLQRLVENPSWLLV